MLNKAIEALKDGVCLAVYNPNINTFKTYAGSGVKPLVRAISADRELFAGAFAADKTVGRAAALLFVYAGVSEVYGAVMSEPAAEALAEYGVKFSYGRFVPNILDRTGAGVCPMEKFASRCAAPQAAWALFSERLLG